MLKGLRMRQTEILREEERGETERNVGREAREQHRKRIKWSAEIKGWSRAEEMPRSRSGERRGRGEEIDRGQMRL